MPNPLSTHRGLRREFEELVATLRQRAGPAVRSRQLRDFAMADDGTLPWALLDLSVGAVLDRTYDELIAVDGVGLKKLHCLMTLLRRAIEWSSGDGPPPPMLAALANDPRPEATAFGSVLGVSEVVWGHWRAILLAGALRDEPLGRYLGRLGSLPRREWFVPLRARLLLRLDALHALRGFGPHKVAALVEMVARLAQFAYSGQSLDEARPLAVREFLRELAERPPYARRECYESLPGLSELIEHDLGARAREAFDVLTAHLRLESRSLGRGHASLPHYYRNCVSDFVLARCPEAQPLLMPEARESRPRAAHPRLPMQLARSPGSAIRSARATVPVPHVPSSHA